MKVSQSILLIKTELNFPDLWLSEAADLHFATVYHPLTFYATERTIVNVTIDYQCHNILVLFSNPGFQDAV